MRSGSVGLTTGALTSAGAAAYGQSSRPWLQDSTIVYGLGIGNPAINPSEGYYRYAPFPVRGIGLNMVGEDSFYMVQPVAFISF